MTLFFSAFSFLKAFGNKSKNRLLYFRGRKHQEKSLEDNQNAAWEFSMKKNKQCGNSLFNTGKAYRSSLVAAQRPSQGIYLTTKGILQMNHIEMALLKKELQRLKEDYQKCKDELLKEYIMEDIVLIGQVISMNESESGAKV